MRQAGPEARQIKVGFSIPFKLLTEETKTLIGEHIPLRIASSQGLGADAARKALFSISHEGEPQHDLAAKNYPLTDQSISSCDQVSWTSWKLFVVVISGVVLGILAATAVLLHDKTLLDAFFAYIVAGIAGLLVAAVAISFIIPD